MAVREDGAELTEYERRVVAELRAGGTRARLVELPILRSSGLRRWHRQFRREVQAEARERGLTYLDTSIIAKTVAATFVPCTVIGFFAGLGGILIIPFIIATIVFGERTRVWLSRAGRETLARWLGVRLWLEAHEVFADLPPASVTVWVAISPTAPPWTSSGRPPFGPRRPPRSFDQRLAAHSAEASSVPAQPRRVPQRASITMTILAEPMIIETLRRPEPTTRGPRPADAACGALPLSRQWVELAGGWHGRAGRDRRSAVSSGRLAVARPVLHCGWAATARC